MVEWLILAGLLWDYSKIASSLKKLTSVNVSFNWSPEADMDFERLKKLFSTAVVLIQPDPSKHFDAEVDTSDVWAGLSHYTGPDKQLHPCAFYSCSFSPAESNYDVGNRELLAVKLALEEWRHLLEGAEQPSVVWTDHKNLSYSLFAK